MDFSKIINKFKGEKKVISPHEQIERLKVKVAEKKEANKVKEELYALKQQERELFPSASRKVLNVLKTGNEYVNKSQDWKRKRHQAQLKNITLENKILKQKKIKTGFQGRGNEGVPPMFR